MTGKIASLEELKDKLHPDAISYKKVNIISHIADVLYRTSLKPSGEAQYLDLLQRLVLMEKHDPSKNRTKVDTHKIFGHQMHFDLSEGFPLLTTKKLHTRSIFIELLRFLRGETNTKRLQEKGVTIRDEWATAEQCSKYGREEGNLGPVYGHQWRNFGSTLLENGEYAPDGVDQIDWVISEIQKNPNSRRLIVTARHPKEQREVTLPPCHTLFQFGVKEGKLSCHLLQRSADVFLGLPFNIASYALLTHMIAQVCDLKVGEFVRSGSDVHLYVNHIDAAKEQLNRDPRPFPKIRINPDVKNINDFTYEDFQLENYNPHPIIKASVAV